MGLEVERKYLAANECWRQHVGPGTPYVQGYVSVDPERSVRVRIDEFSAENRGLIIAEVEIEDYRRDIVTPEWVVEGVTNDPRYFNINLVKHPYSEWVNQE